MPFHLLSCAQTLLVVLLRQTALAQVKISALEIDSLVQSRDHFRHATEMPASID